MTSSGRSPNSGRCSTSTDRRSGLSLDALQPITGAAVQAGLLSVPLDAQRPVPGCSTSHGRTGLCPGGAGILPAPERAFSPLRLPSAGSSYLWAFATHSLVES